MTLYAAEEVGVQRAVQLCGRRVWVESVACAQQLHEIQSTINLICALKSALLQSGSTFAQVAMYFENLPRPESLINDWLKAHS